jgi:actin-like ATPase involved in cell morphogenesis
LIGGGTTEIAVIALVELYAQIKKIADVFTNDIVLHAYPTQSC